MFHYSLCGLEQYVQMQQSLVCEFIPTDNKALIWASHSHFLDFMHDSEASHRHCEKCCANFEEAYQTNSFKSENSDVNSKHYLDAASEYKKCSKTPEEPYRKKNGSFTSEDFKISPKPGKEFRFGPRRQIVTTTSMYSCRRKSPSAKKRKVHFSDERTQLEELCTARRDRIMERLHDDVDLEQTRCTVYTGEEAASGQEFGVSIPDSITPVPTVFIPRTETISVDTDNEEAQTIFVDSFLQNNRLENFIQVMAYHPQYVESFLRTHNYLLRGDGPLPYEHRHYIAIMASARHQCSYLVSLHTREFILQGGDRSWLRGLQNVPQKLRDLAEVNKLLAHRPWLLNKAHIGKLLRGTDNWSMSELMHAIALLAHFHALCSFIYGCGVGDEIDQQQNGFAHTSSCGSDTECKSRDDVREWSRDSPRESRDSPRESRDSPRDSWREEEEERTSAHNSHSTSPNSFKDNGGGMIETLMKRMKKLMEEEPEEPSQEEMLARFEKVERQNAELTARMHKPSPKASILLFVADPDYTYQDFARRGETQNIATFRAQDYSWEDHGYSLANRLYTDIGSLLDDKFQIAYNLTYNTMGDNEDVDTTAFRRGIWNYIHCMFGIRHDDYDYGEVNHLLERSLKSYIKTVTCYPERVTRADYESFMKEFKHSEKVHVNLMLLEARLQAELLYALRALNNYMT